jgi:hypothetical protein
MEKYTEGSTRSIHYLKRFGFFSEKYWTFSREERCKDMVNEIQTESDTWMDMSCDIDAYCKLACNPRD